MRDRIRELMDRHDLQERLRDGEQSAGESGRSGSGASAAAAEPARYSAAGRARRRATVPGGSDGDATRAAAPAGRWRTRWLGPARAARRRGEPRRPAARSLTD